MPSSEYLTINTYVNKRQAFMAAGRWPRVKAEHEDWTWNVSHGDALNTHAHTLTHFRIPIRFAGKVHWNPRCVQPKSRFQCGRQAHLEINFITLTLSFENKSGKRYSSKLPQQRLYLTLINSERVHFHRNEKLNSLKINYWVDSVGNFPVRTKHRRPFCAK